ncbi:hypothetical protein CDO52_18680 [Nocardiopsis gilva YIM 90087]|uniref:Uncharacterized protein n=1 Tax=Nocardiopsis gilva YIM 90087 TaxID=1235441 RepID=A0A223S8Y5_9ACTN|nr:hypothetical protein [Nocardiopsis gilva]ASU84558.1 hypothetical protein CDO52_18680 [Nocardiopsis gilva YIM 90087]
MFGADLTELFNLVIWNIPEVLIGAIGAIFALVKSTKSRGLVVTAMALLAISGVLGMVWQAAIVPSLSYDAFAGVALAYGVVNRILTVAIWVLCLMAIFRRSPEQTPAVPGPAFGTGPQPGYAPAPSRPAPHGYGAPWPGHQPPPGGAQPYPGVQPQPGVQPHPGPAQPPAPGGPERPNPGA